MKTDHIEFLVEEPSMEAFLRSFMPSLLRHISFEVYSYQGKLDLLGRLEERLMGYSRWLPDRWRIVVLLDRDDDDCLKLKACLEALAEKVRLTTRRSGGEAWRIIFRIAIEELESWYFGDWEAVRLAYPGVSKDVTKKAAYRRSDEILGGTWEAFEREAQKAGYFTSGLRKIEAARAIGQHFDFNRCSSRSFGCMARSLLEVAS